jgi:hypothetical protein
MRFTLFGFVFTIGGKRADQPSYDQERSCLRKVRYGHGETARLAIERQPGKPLAYYACDYCGGYHLTSQVPHP